MTATVLTVFRPRAGRHARPALLPVGWPLVALCSAMPLLYVLGIHAFMWSVPAIAFGAKLVTKRRVSIPGVAIPLALLAGWIPLSGLLLAPRELPVFAYRYSLFLATLAALLWVVNTSEEAFSTAYLVRLLGRLWITLVGFGYLALLLPRFSAPSLFQLGAPRAIVDVPYLFDLTRIRFAELQTLGEFSTPRPAAPMAYTNGWGSTLGLLTPFYFVDYLLAADPRRRRRGIVLGVIALVPMIISVNRGLWLSLSVALAYVGVRRALAGDLRLLLGVTLAAVIVVNLLILTPLGATVDNKFNNQGESNETRSELYEAAFAGAKDSPLVGWGAPVDIGLFKQVGTHGLLWYMMFVHGFPALVLLLAFVVVALAATARAPTPTALFAHVAVVVFAVQVPYYGLLPQIVVVGLAIGICVRERLAVAAAHRDSRASGMVDTAVLG
jgi:hypothetical protein